MRLCLLCRTRKPQGNRNGLGQLVLYGNVRREVPMTDLHLWRRTHVSPMDDMRGTVHEETNYAVGWLFSAFLTAAVVAVVWQFGF